MEILIMSIIFAVFTSYVMLKVGILSSYSDSYYELPGMQKHLFTLFIIGLSVCMAELAVRVQNMTFFSAAAVLCFAGIAAAFKQKGVGWIHSVGAVGGIALSALGLVIAKEYEIVTGMVLISVGLNYLKVDNKTWWVEKLNFALIVWGLHRLYA